MCAVFSIIFLVPIVNLPLICVFALLMYYLNEYFNELLE